MQPIFKGIPELFELVTHVVERRAHRDSLSIVAFRTLSKILECCEHAMIHYFTLTLNEPFLQNSHRGTPYQKWADGVNQDFQRVDQHVKSLAPTIEELSFDTYDLNTGSFTVGEIKHAAMWLTRLNKEYECCVVNLGDPSMTLSAISFEKWLDPTGSPFTFDSDSGTPPVAINSEISIDDRAVLTDIQHDGIIRVEELRSLLTHFAAWLDTNYTMSDITVVPPKKQISYTHG